MIKVKMRRLKRWPELNPARRIVYIRPDIGILLAIYRLSELPAGWSLFVNLIITFLRFLCANPKHTSTTSASLYNNFPGDFKLAFAACTVANHGRRS